MKTKSKEKIEKAEKLAAVIQKRKNIELMEDYLKDYFKDDIGEGVLEAGAIVIMVEQKQRVTLDRDALIKTFGEEKIKQFEKITEYKQVNVTKKAA